MAIPPKVLTIKMFKKLRIDSIIDPEVLLLVFAGEVKTGRGGVDGAGGRVCLRTIGDIVRGITGGGVTGGGVSGITGGTYEIQGEPVAVLNLSPGLQVVIGGTIGGGGVAGGTTGGDGVEDGAYPPPPQLLVVKVTSAP